MNQKECNEIFNVITSYYWTYVSVIKNSLKKFKSGWSALKFSLFSWVYIPLAIDGSYKILQSKQNSLVGTKSMHGKIIPKRHY